MMQRVVGFGLGLLMLVAAHGAPVPANFGLRHNQRVVFIGDSITHADGFISYVEAALVTRFPGFQVELINRGLPGETAHWTTQAENNAALPNIHTRFSTTVPALRPDLVVVSYGMNDGYYRAPNAENFKQFQDGVTALLDRILLECGAQTLLLTPPPFDNLPIQNRPPSAVFDVRNPFPNYDLTLQQFSQWLLSIRREHVRTIDMHTLLLQHTAVRRQFNPSFTLSPDGVHPSATGHWLMAQALLQVWNFPAFVSEARVDARSRYSATGANVRNIVVARDGKVSFDWLSPLPLPIDPDIDPASLVAAQSHQLLNRHTLFVTNLRTNEYILVADGKPLTGFTGPQYANGIPMSQLPGWPLNEKALAVLKAVQTQRNAARNAWVAQDRHPRFLDMKPRAVAAEREITALRQQVRQLAQPTLVKVELRPIPQRVPGDTNLPPTGVNSAFLTNMAVPNAPAVIQLRQ